MSRRQEPPCPRRTARSGGGRRHAMRSTQCGHDLGGRYRRASACAVAPNGPLSPWPRSHGTASGQGPSGTGTLWTRGGALWLGHSSLPRGDGGHRGSPRWGTPGADAGATAASEPIDEAKASAAAPCAMTEGLGLRATRNGGHCATEVTRFGPGTKAAQLTQLTGLTEGPTAPVAAKTAQLLGPAAAYLVLGAVSPHVETIAKPGGAIHGGDCKHAMRHVAGLRLHNCRENREMRNSEVRCCASCGGCGLPNAVRPPQSPLGCPLPRPEQRRMARRRSTALQRQICSGTAQL